MLATGHKAELEILSIAGRHRRSEQALQDEREQSNSTGVERAQERDALVDFVEEKLQSMLRRSAE